MNFLLNIFSDRNFVKEKTKQKLIILSFFSFFYVLMFPSIGSTFEDTIIAVVNDELITLQDLKDYIKTTYAEFSTRGMDATSLKRIKNELEANGIHKLIEDNLMLSKANDLGLEVNAKIITQQIDEIKERYPSEQIFTDALILHGATMTDLRKKVENQLKIKYLIQFEVESKIFVNPQEVTLFYEKNKRNFKKGKRVNVDSIFIALRDNPLSSRQKAKEALDFIGNGIDFKEIANRYSETPSIGVIEKGQLISAIEKAIFNLNEGEVSSMIEVANGIYIFKLIKKIPAEVAPLSEVKDTIYKQIYQVKFQNSFKKWLNELKKDSYIEIKTK